MQAFTGGARLAQVAAAAPPLSSEAAALLAAQTNPMADGPALPKFSSLIAGLGVAPDRSGPPPPPGSRLPLRLLSSPTDPERTLWKTIAELGLHEILSLEFVDALAEHILSALPPAAVGQPGDAAALPVVLEVGAGSGALAHQLSIRLDGRARVVASDDFSSRLATVIDVSPLDCAAALSEHSPALVLISWMPSGVDWTAEIRACASVQAYVLVGEPDDENCGDTWATWGHLPEDAVEYGLYPDSQPAYKADGWERVDVEAASAYQICRFDSAVARGYSQTVGFHRTTSQ